jgi:hypothetical protein
MERTQETELAVVLATHPADALHVLEEILHVLHFMHVHLPEQSRVSVEREVRKRREHEVLAEDEFLNGPARADAY